MWIVLGGIIMWLFFGHKKNCLPDPGSGLPHDSTIGFIYTLLVGGFKLFAKKKIVKIHQLGSFPPRGPGENKQSLKPPGRL